jgi:adenylate cyclase
MARSLDRFLRRRGASAEEINEARRNGYLTLLALDRSLIPGARKYTQTEVATRAGTDVETARAVWRAIGFPDLPDEVPAFTDADIAALRRFLDRIANPWIYWSPDQALSQARITSSALARIADAESDDLVRSVTAARQDGLDDEATAELIAARLDYDEVARLFDHAHRLQLRAALWRKLAGNDPEAPGTVDATVGFVDLVGYTSLAEGLDDAELSALIERFAALAHETVVSAGGRIVKTIGDEVMFIADRVATGAHIALELSAASTRDSVLPQARAGLAAGPVLSREGDYFGAVVNLASRLTRLAFPGTVLVSREVAAALTGDEAFRLRRIARQRVRGIGRLEVFRLDPTAVTDDSAARRGEAPGR